MTLIDPYQSHVDAINRDGLRMRRDEEESVVRVKAATSIEGPAAPDLIIVLVNSFHTREAIRAARAIVGPNTVVMSLQDGMGHEDEQNATSNR